jgi:mRNA interferase MazF
MAMKRAGQIVLTPFTYTDLPETRLCPVLMLRQASRFDDWLVCMVSSQVHQAEANLDEIISSTEPDFVTSGLNDVALV